MSRHVETMVAQLVKICPWNPTWVPSLDWEDPLEEGMATHSSIIAWRIPVAEEPGGLQFLVFQTVRQDWTTKCTHTLLLPILYWNDNK